MGEKHKINKINKKTKKRKEVMEEKKSVIVVGCGIFGVSSAIELKKRGYEVKMIDREAVPHQEASSTDISKIVRLDYGSDELLTELMEKSIEGWRKMNKEFGDEIYHENGLLVLSSRKMEKGSFEYESLEMMGKRGVTDFFSRQKKQTLFISKTKKWLKKHKVRKLGNEELKKEFPAWREGKFMESYLNPQSGWVESGKAVALLLQKALEMDIHLIISSVTALIFSEQNNKVRGVTLEDGTSLDSDYVVLSAGPWSPSLLPSLKRVLRPTAQTVFHFEIPKELKHSFSHPNFTAYTCDIQQTGFYGFPAHPFDGRLKVGHHAVGNVMEDPTTTKIINYGDRVRKEKEKLFREFLKDNLPSMAEAPVIGYRTCLYCDSYDGNFFICRHPAHENLIISTGGSGHGFKFGPMLGILAADSLEGKSNKFAQRFEWREPSEKFIQGDESRCLEKNPLIPTKSSLPSQC